MIAYITQALNNFATKISNLELSFEAGDIVMPEAEAHGSMEVEAPQPPPEMICGILSQIKDPSEIANLMEINRTWYREGSRLLYKNRDEFMKWLRINRIEQLDNFIRYLKLDRLDEYWKIHENINNEYEKAFDHLEKVRDEYFYAKMNYEDYGYDDQEEDDDREEDDDIDELDLDDDEIFTQRERYMFENKESELITQLVELLTDQVEEDLYNELRRRHQSLEEAKINEKELDNQMISFGVFIQEHVGVIYQKMSYY
jgi:hypothetical protein